MSHRFQKSYLIQDEPHESDYLKLASQSLQLPTNQIGKVKLAKRSIDARKKDIKVNLTFEVFLPHEEEVSPVFKLKMFLIRKPCMLLVVGRQVFLQHFNLLT